MVVIDIEIGMRTGEKDLDFQRAIDYVENNPHIKIRVVKSKNI